MTDHSPLEEIENRRWIVIGGTHRDFREWCYDNKVPVMLARHITQAEQLMGLELKQDGYFRLGYLSPEAEMILKTRIR